MTVPVAVLNFSHLDLSWLGTQEECLSQGNKIIALALNEAERDAEYRFHIEYVIFLDYYLRTHPEDLPRLGRLAQNGQVEIGVVWTGLHSSHQPGETFARNVLLAKRFVREKLGIEPVGATMSDLPGHTPQLPQILAKSGVKIVQMTRHGPRRHRLFFWQALDGTRLLTWADSPWWNEGGGYGWSIFRGLTESVQRMHELGFERDLLADRPNSAADLYLIQAGNDLVIPYPRLQQRLREWNAQSEVQLKLMNLSEYHSAVVNTPNLPVLCGEVPCAWSYTSAVYADHYILDQEATFALLAAERYAALASTAAGVPYPAADLRRAWLGLAIAGDHNWDNQGARIGDRRKLEERKRALQIAEDVTGTSLAPLAERVPAAGPHALNLVAFNPSSWTRTGLAQAHFTMYWRDLVRRWDVLPNDQFATDSGDPHSNPLMGTPRGGFNYTAQGFEIVDDGGERVPYQIIEDLSRETRDTTFLFPVEVPPLGYRVYTLRPAKKPPTFPSTVTLRHNDLPRSQDWVFENRWFTITLHPPEGTFRIWDRMRQRDVVREGSVQVRSHIVTPDFSRVERGAQTWGSRFQNIGVVEAGGVRTTLQVQVQSAHPDVRAMKLRMSLCEEDPLIDLDIHLDAVGTDLSSIHLVLATAPSEPEVTYAVPFGANRLDNVMPETGPRDEYGFPRMDQESWTVTRLVMGWLDVSDKSSGLTIASNRRLFRFEGDTLHCVLMRLTPHAQPQHSRFRLWAHDGHWGPATPRLAEEFLMPIPVYTVNDNVGQKTMPRAMAWLSVEPANVMVTAVKQAEAGGMIVVRLLETCGRAATARLISDLPLRAAFQLDLTEQALGPIDPAQIPIGAYEIVTLGIEF